MRIGQQAAPPKGIGEAENAGAVDPEELPKLANGNGVTGLGDGFENRNASI